MSTIKTNAILDSSGGNTATINGIPLRPGVLDPENRIINGAFDFWQRGASFTADAYGADRWKNAAGGGTVTMSRQSFTLGDTLGSNSPTYFLRQTVSGQTLSSELALIEQRIESVRSYAGQTITVLGWARRSSGTGNMVVELEQNFGTGGSPSSPVTTISPTTVTLSGSWQPFAVVASVPSITGKALGNNGNDFLRLLLWTSAGSNNNARTNSLGLQTIGVDLWGIHIKVGMHTAAATSLYRQPELGSEFDRCRRYYEVVPVAFAMNTTSFLRLLVPYKVTKRRFPSATATRAVLVWNGSAWVAPTTLGIFPFHDHIVVETTLPSHSSVGNPTDNTALLAIDAEL